MVCVRYVKILLQIALLCVIALIGNGVAALLPFKLPGSIIGIGILFLLIERNWLAMAWVEEGSNLLISELLLFFIPSAIGVMQFSDLLLQQPVKLLSVIFISTLSILACIAGLGRLMHASRERGGRM